MPVPDLRRWMAGLDGTLRLIDITMPGAHDAGVYKAGHVTGRMGGLKRFAVCQDVNFLRQAQRGCRFFDCRVFLQPSKVLDSNADKFDKRLRMGHFAVENSIPVLGGQGMGGAYGGSLKDAIEHATTFVRSSPGEVVILRFSHTGCHELVERALMQWIGRDDEWAGAIYMGQGNIATQPIDLLRGRVVLIFDTADHPNVSANCWRYGFHRYHRVTDDNQGNAIQDGLGACGIYQGTTDMRTVKENAEYGAGYHARDHIKDHLHFVYYQQTMFLKSVKKATTKETGDGGAHSQLPDYLASLGDGPYPNVISHDFVRTETCERIIELNPRYR